jgi:hypothetical protein
VELLLLFVKVMKNLIKSIFEPIIQDVYVQKCPIKCKQIILDRVNESKINDKDKQLILRNLDTKKTLIALQTYATNSMFQYEGLGLNQIN